MGLILQGIGKGSLFGHGRILGVHKPWGSASGKAKDPYINNRTLIRLSRHTNAEVRNVAVQNLAKRIEAGRVHWRSSITLLGHPETNIKVAAVTSLMKTFTDLKSRLDNIDLVVKPSFSRGIDELTRKVQHTFFRAQHDVRAHLVDFEGSQGRIQYQIDMESQRIKGALNLEIYRLTSTLRLIGEHLKSDQAFIEALKLPEVPKTTLGRGLNLLSQSFDDTPQSRKTVLDILVARKVTKREAQDILMEAGIRDTKLFELLEEIVNCLNHWT